MSKKVTVYGTEFGAPYSVFSEYKSHERAYTVAALLRARYLDASGGKVRASRSKALPAALKALIGPSAFNYWRRSRKLIEGAKLTDAGWREVKARISGDTRQSNIDPAHIAVFAKSIASGKPANIDGVTYKFNARHQFDI